MRLLFLFELILPPFLPPRWKIGKSRVAMERKKSDQRYEVSLRNALSIQKLDPDRPARCGSQPRSWPATITSSTSAPLKRQQPALHVQQHSQWQRCTGLPKRSRASARLSSFRAYSHRQVEEHPPVAHPSRRVDMRKLHTALRQTLPHSLRGSRSP